MTHDPLCPSPLAPPTSCECDLIARVVERERGKGRRYLLADDENTNAQAYRQAIADAAEAARAVCDVESDKYVMPYDQMDAAVAAIEALKEKP